MKIDGRWEGKLLDMSGLVALVTARLKEKNDAITGDFSVFFLSPAGDGCGKTIKRLAQTGPVSGKIDRKTNRIQLSHKLTIEGIPGELAFVGSITEADPHAISAIYGYYEVVEGAVPLTIEGGTCLLWLYRYTQKGEN